MKFVRVMDKETSNASGKKFKIGEVNVAEHWDSSATTIDTIKGINFSTEESIIRWIRRGDTLYEVEIPKDAEVIKVPGTFTPDGIYRTNKIIVKNPVSLTEDIVMDLYNKSNIPEKTYHDVLAILAIRGFEKVCMKLISDKVNTDNIDEFIRDYIEFENDINDNNYGLYEKYKTILLDLKDKYQKDNNNSNKMIKFKSINKNNLELACKIQNTIFPKEDARQNYIEHINNDPYRKELEYYIVYLNKTPIGVTGIYSYNEYPKTAWLGWFGILEEHRNKGYGRQVLIKTIELAKKKGYTEFRLYTDEFAKIAHRLYESIGLIKEKYDNENDKDEYFIADIYIFSMSLTDKQIKLWNNKTLGLKEQGEKENLYK